MKTLLVFLLTLTLAAARPAASTYQVNSAASRITWTGYAEVGTYAPTGTVLLRRGTFEYDGRTPRNGRFEFDMRTLAQEQEQLAEHLRGADFFDVEKYPTAVFVLKDVQQGTARGQLTLHGITRAVQFPLLVERLPAGRLRITGTARLDRTLFGVNHNSSSFFQNLGSYAIRNDFQLAFDVVAAKSIAE
ncbi:YceI family protein [Hymenobacter lutimineralis]|uniref:YceI family protein n=1 Tax=Hymenobacter lutimineralis TaxID=2606448 RepID=A0A5D6VFM8_9BACT|nr:YceI family protein [Hymenobacter lutimineralis]TYZ14296.1 YceI family protein [Hymenobacter lutimineralis]